MKLFRLLSPHVLPAALAVFLALAVTCLIVASPKW
jgi:hypothetical protein